MQNAFSGFRSQQQLFDPSDRILLAVSGGVDSVVMCALFHNAGLRFGIAHCNFGLRGAESDADEAFVEALAVHYNVPFHTVAFETSAFAKKQKLSIQAAARRLRYEWFESLRLHFKYAFIATAHHRDDSAETFLINLVRGTGIAGLHGILPKQGRVIRPLLFAAKAEIIAYAGKHGLEYREDSSNASERYLRNRIRHQVIPALKELNAAAEDNILQAMDYLRGVEKIYKKEVERQRKRLVKIKGNTACISIGALQKLDPPEAFLYEFLKPFHFNAGTVRRIIAALDVAPGKQFFSETHRLVKDRELLLVEEKEKIQEELFVTEDSNARLPGGGKLVCHTEERKADFIIPSSGRIVALDCDKLEFPLLLRKWKKGDWFRPIGMKGKKLLSDFFIDEKLSLPGKEAVWLLVSGGEIVWVAGYRPDDRYKITAGTKKIFFAEMDGVA